MFRVFEKVVVLINDIEKIDDLLKKGVEFANGHKKKLEVLFVHETPTFSLPDYFFSSHSSKKAKLDRNAVESKIKKHIHHLDSGIKSIVFILEGNTLNSVLSHAKGNTNILFISSYEKKTTQKLLEKTPYSYLIFKNSSFIHHNIIMPIELDAGAKDDIKLIKDVFPKSAIEIVHDYRYRIPNLETDGSISIVPVVGHLDKELHQETREKERNIFENYKKEFNIQGDFIEEKKGLNIDLLNYIENRDTDLIVIHHQEELMFVPSVTFNLLDKVSSDFLVLNR